MLHLKFTVLRQVPSDALTTHGNACERKALRQFMQKGDTIVGDRYYGLDFGFLEEPPKLGISFVFRIRNKPRMEIVEELPLTAADRAAGVTWQGMVRLGDKWQSEPIRVVKVEMDGKELLLVAPLEIRSFFIPLTYSQQPLCRTVLVHAFIRPGGRLEPCRLTCVTFASILNPFAAQSCANQVQFSLRHSSSHDRQ